MYNENKTIENPILKAKRLADQLIRVVLVNSSEQVCRLIQAGADVNRPADYGLTPLYWAARNGHDQVIQLLVEKRISQMGFDVRVISRCSEATKGILRRITMFIMNCEAGEYYTGFRSFFPANLGGNYHRDRKIAVAKKLFEVVLRNVDGGSDLISFTEGERDILSQGELRELYRAYEASLGIDIELVSIVADRDQNQERKH